MKAPRPGTPSPAPGLTLGSFGRTLVEALRARVELAAIELVQEQDRVGRLALLAALTIVLLCLGLQLLAVLAVVWLWDTPYRVPAAAGMAGLFTVAGAGCAFAFARSLKSKPRAFDGSLQALAADAEAVV